MPHGSGYLSMCLGRGLLSGLETTIHPLYERIQIVDILVGKLAYLPTIAADQ